MAQKNIEGVNMEWFGQSGFLLKNDKTIYIDPFKISGSEKADIILITHEHSDHCSIEDIKKIIKPETIIVTVPDCQSKLSGMEIANVTLVKPGNRLNIKGTLIETVPAYNLNKKFHPKENEWVGYIITINGKRIYHAGDTDYIPEMKNLKNIDIAMVPVSGTYVMSPSEAAMAVNDFRPKVAIPMHYGGIIGTKEDAEKFRSLAKVNVEIMG
ncbi:Zn-dependent hydrolase [Candidatus Woesearchaeota archaeon CG10_big_fil_rev_8_21_14_0_10_44_13]|nr:MAG: Zn-dependent hydrolase [Candidatus Woesearchaeota archaeon CG10_big_fil_rev_8_21_14_0_10_44_13]